MPELKEKQETKVSVEDLLKFKRQETPGHDFWESFDCSMQKKTIQALVREKPKHHRVMPHLLKWGLGAVPMTGAAVFSMSVLLNRAPISGVADSEVDAGIPVVVQDEATGDSLTVVVAQQTPDSVEQYQTIANHASYVMDVLNPFDGQQNYKTIQTAQTLSVNAPEHTRYAASTIKPNGLSSVLASVPSFDHF